MPHSARAGAGSIKTRPPKVISVGTRNNAGGGFAFRRSQQAPRMETSTSTWSSMKRVRSFWTKGLHLSDLESVQTPEPAACSNPSCATRESTNNSRGFRIFSNFCAWQAARPSVYVACSALLFFQSHRESAPPAAPHSTRSTSAAPPAAENPRRRTRARGTPALRSRAVGKHKVHNKRELSVNSPCLACTVTGRRSFNKHPFKKR